MIKITTQKGHRGVWSSCDTCKKLFPAHLIRPLFLHKITSYNGDITQDKNIIKICPMCALKAIRTFHNMPSFQFTSKINKAMYHQTAMHLVPASKDKVNIG